MQNSLFACFMVPFESLLLLKTTQLFLMCFAVYKINRFKNLNTDGTQLLGTAPLPSNPSKVQPIT